MPAAAAAVELLPKPTAGRVFSDSRNVRLGDVDRRGRLRLDATARLLQDVATDDASDAKLDRRFGWLVRRTLIETSAVAKLGEAVDVDTWCTGIGRSWAERRTSIVGEHGAQIDAVSLWVQIDVSTGMPSRIGDDFRSAYGETAASRTVSSRLRLDTPAEQVERVPWHVRRTDLDPFDHVNNAATWDALEEVAALDTLDDRRGTAEIEYLQPVTFGESVEVLHECIDGCTKAWMTGDRGVLTAMCWSAASEA